MAVGPRSDAATTGTFDGSGDAPILEVENLCTVYYTEKETIRAVDRISFDLHPGETLGIVGESGSGKSVTARSVMRLIKSPGRILEGTSMRFYHPETVRTFSQTFWDHTVDLGALAEAHDSAAFFDHPNVEASPATFGYADPGEATIQDFISAGYGEVLGLVDDEDFVFVTEGDPGVPESIENGYVEITRLTEKAQRQMRGGRIAIVFQDPLTSLNPLYTVGNQIKEALRLHQGMRGETATREAAALLEAVGIPDARRRVKEYPHQFSGGMRQRAVIAMALACEPEVLICDEPTTALDVTIQAQILDLLAELQAERGLAIIFITHDMGVIAEVADRVNVMYAGEFVEKAEATSLFDHPKHPYTQGLLRSIPGQQEGERLETIEGNVPTPNEPATYCRFAPRCPKAFDDCDVVHPSLLPVEGDDTDHTAACLLYPDDLPRRRAVERHEMTEEMEGRR